MAVQPISLPKNCPFKKIPTNPRTSSSPQQIPSTNSSSLLFGIYILENDNNTVLRGICVVFTHRPIRTDNLNNFDIHQFFVGQTSIALQIFPKEAHVIKCSKRLQMPL
jgi:hypothetical protein